MDEGLPVNGCSVREIFIYIRAPCLLTGKALRPLHDWHQKDIPRPIFLLFHGPEFALAVITVHFALRDGMDRFTVHVPKIPFRGPVVNIRGVSEIASHSDSSHSWN